MHRSKLDIGGADAGAGGMSIISGSGGASGIGASSSSSDASDMAHSTGSLGAGSGSTCFANKSPVACSSLAFSTASRKSSSLSARKRRVPVVHARFLSHRSVTARDAHSVEDWRGHDLVVENTVEDRAGQRRGRLRLDAALEAAEDGHVAGLQVRSASWWDEAQQDMNESGQGGLTGVDARKIVRSSKKTTERAIHKV